MAFVVSSKSGGFRTLLPPRLQAAIWRHPEHWLVLAVVAAWAMLAMQQWGHHNEHTSHGFDIMMWSIMVVAMMLPGVIPMVRHVAFASLWSRRHRAVALFVAVYVLGWISFGVAMALIAGLAQHVFGILPDDRLLVLLFGAIATVWQLTRTKFRAMRRCHLRKHVGASGWSADRSVVRYSVEHGWACFGSCWAIMALMLVSSHSFYLMVSLTFVTFYERVRAQPQGMLGAVVIALTLGISLLH